MTITAQSADGVNHQFPDGTPSAVIDKVMKQYAASSKGPQTAMPTPKAQPTAKPMSYADQIADVGKSALSGLGKGVAAVAGLPGDLQDLTAWGVKKLTGYDVDAQPQVSVPGVGDAGGRVPDSAAINAAFAKPTGGYHKPKTTAGKYAETIASFAPAVAGGPGSVAKRLLTRAIVPGAASEAAGQAARDIDPSLEPYARVAGAVAGGGVTALGKPIVRSLNSLTSRAGAPIIDPAVGAREAVAAAVKRDGGASAAMSKVNEFAASGASNPALVDVTGNNTARLVRMAASSPKGEGQNMAVSYSDKIAADLQGRGLSHAGRLPTASSETSADYAATLEKQQNDLAQKQYREPYSAPAAVTPDMVSALQGPEGRGAIGAAYADARANRDLQQMGELQDLLTVAKEQGGGSNIVTGKKQTIEQALGELSAGSLDRVRIAMRDMGRGFSSRGMNSRARGYFGRVSDIDTALDQTPGLRDARAGYRGMQAERDALDLGNSALKTPSDDYVGQLARLSKQSPGAPLSAAVGHKQAIINAISRPAEGRRAIGPILQTSTGDMADRNLAASFGDEAAQKYSAASKLEVGRVRKADFISPNLNSQTEPRQSEGILAMIPRSAHGFIAKVIDHLRGGLTLTTQEKDEIVKLGLTEADLRGVLSKLPAHNAGRNLRAPAAAAALSLQTNGSR